MSRAAAHALNVRNDADGLPGSPAPRLIAEDLPPDLDHRNYRTIPGTNGRYLVNIVGGTPQVYDLETDRALSPNPVKGGRLRFRINYVIGKPVRRILLSRLVCEATQGPSPYYRNRRTAHQAHHVDGNRLNDHADNLVWVTPKQHDKITRRRLKSAQPDPRMATQKYGDQNSRIKSRKTQSRLYSMHIAKIIKLVFNGVKVTVLARDFKTTPTTIYRLINGQTRHRDVYNAYTALGLPPPSQTVDFVSWD